MHSAVVVDRDYGSVSLEKLVLLQKQMQESGIDLRLAHYQSEDEIIEGCQNAQSILATGNPPITARVLQSLPRLRQVQRFGIGYNSIDLEAATECGVVVMYMPNFCVDELAAHAASLILGLIRNTAYYDRGIRAGGWPKAGYYMPRSIETLTLGLYGFGGSARPLYRIFHEGFGVRVMACDPFVDPRIQDTYAVELVDFDTLLAESDIISLHAPLNAQTHHIFGEQAFRKMKPESMIVNIARGGLIDEDALVRALQAGEIRFAGLDVYEQEPIAPDHPFLKMENLLLTCHSAFYGEKAQATQLRLAYELVNQLLNSNKVEAKYIANRAVLQIVKGIVVQ